MNTKKIISMLILFLAFAQRANREVMEHYCCMCEKTPFKNDVAVFDYSLFTMRKLNSSERIEILYGPTFVKHI